MRTLIALLLLVGLAGCVRSEGVDKNQLRTLARLPTVFLGGSIVVRNGEFYVPGDDSERMAELAAVRMTVKNGSAKPEDYFRLIELAADKEERDEALKRFIELGRQHLKAQPRDARIMARLGMALTNGRTNEGDWQGAEKLIRQAVAVDPNDAVCWTTLGQFLYGKAVRALGYRDKHLPNNARELLNLARQGAFTAEQAAAAEKLLDEILPCFDKAVAAAPKEGRAYVMRAESWWWQLPLRPALRLAQGQPIKEVPRAVPPEVARDFREAARLLPNNPRAIGYSIMLECMRICAEQGIPDDGGQKGGPWKALPAKTREWMALEMTKLEKLGEVNDKKAAARALEVRSFIILLLHSDEPAAEKCCRRAVALDPARDWAWNMLLGFTYVRNHKITLIEICRNRLQRKDCARNRFLLAKAYEQAGQFDKSEDQLRIALEKEPDNFHANLGMAALRLKLSKDDVALKEPGSLLDKAAKAINETTSRDNRAEYAVTRAIYLGLKGDVAEAEKGLNEVLSRNRHNREAVREARKALSALGK